MDSADKFCEEKCRHIVEMQMKISNPITTVKVTMPDLKGDQFASMCKHITVNFEDGEPLHFFAKMELAQGKQKDMTKSFQVFQKEGNFLTKFVPEMEEFCQNAGNNELATRISKIFAKAYYADSTTIVMENMVPQGFNCLDKMDKHGYEKICMVLKALATYHGISYCMMKPTGSKEFLEKHAYLREKMFTNEAAASGVAEFFDNSAKSIHSLLQKSTLPRSQTVLKQLEALNYPNSYAIMNDVVNNGNFNLHVVTHGDCWNNNMMFKMDPDTNLPLQVKLIDLQLPRIASPVLDISNYIYSSANAGVRKENLKELLKVYYNELKEIVTALNNTLDVTFEDFLQDFRNHSRFGLMIGLLTSLAFLIMNNVDIHKSDDSMGDFTNFIDKLSKSPETEPILIEVIELAEDYFTFCGSP